MGAPRLRVGLALCPELPWAVPGATHVSEDPKAESPKVLPVSSPPSNHIPRLVYEYTLGEEKFTFIEKCNNPRSITLLIKGPNKHTLTQIKDAIRDGLRAVKNAIDDGRVVPGAGAVEVSMAEALVKYKPSVKDTAQLRVQAFADALLIISKVLVQNSGFDLQETLVKIQAEHSESSQLVGVDLNTVEPMVAAEAGI
ncbi:hypothetical protein MJG53_002839 [Ovis ammon polii x Ovis aries]|uniref:Uncharacterized protein n=1 Tax=Ovis ammon polii x Ovis aries TaxID=2918886 RepID=A0ACB9VFC5_9CETA|nr:hypothetical protein MJG53_002839 [Ovis ammon polii x Ovis aries]